MKILIIDDKREEREKGRQAVLDNGHEAFIKDPNNERLGENLKEEVAAVDGVITDLYFHPIERKFSGDQEHPAGLLVVIEAIHQGKSVIICTDGSHHDVSSSWIFDAYIQHRRREIPFSLTDNKDWDAAVKQLVYLYEKK